MKVAVITIPIAEELNLTTNVLIGVLYHALINAREESDWLNTFTADPIDIEIEECEEPI